jgi:nucleoside-diphosphate-sugar epimerase
VRLLLDAHISGRRVATKLRARGHDVYAADEQRELDGASDEGVLALAASQQRIMVTFDIADFPRIVREWDSENRHHAGVIVFAGDIDHSHVGSILRLLEAAFVLYPDQRAWSDLAFILSAKPAGSS